MSEGAFRAAVRQEIDGAWRAYAISELKAAHDPGKWPSFIDWEPSEQEIADWIAIHAPPASKP